jgi:hypothetical protein
MRVLMWGAYIVAILLTILVKLLRWMHNENPANVSFKASLFNYFIGGQATSLTSITVLGFELLLGAVYCDHLSVVFGSYLESLPTHPALAFFLGSIAETLAPIGVRFVSNKIFPGG